MASYTQHGRMMRVETALGADALLLERFVGAEALSTPYVFTLEMVAPDPDLSADALLRQPASICLVLEGGEERVIHGLVRRFSQLGREDVLTRYRAELVPWLWFLSLSSDCRIFQNQSVPEIVETVFGDLGFSDFDNRCTGSYAQREYCVQYRETHLDFVSRLLEEEGIFYFFEHTEDKHLLVLADAPSTVPVLPGQSTATLAPAGSAWAHGDIVTGVALEHAAQTGKVVHTDYNFLTPSADLTATVAGTAPEEAFDYPGGYGTRDEGDRYARLALEEREARIRQLSGEGTVRAFQPGYRFTLDGHYRRDANKEYLITGVRHKAGSGGFGTDRGDEFDYTNTFTAIPYDVPYRPPHVAPRPVVHGSQTALVVGKSGEEIWVDKYGRVKVQFHWDRRGKKNENSSCWVRVASTWAGKNWGVIQLPRIGQEVIVDFLEGDPDQPIVTGRVYNAEQMPPYALPANGTQSGIKSRSSKQGGEANFNELRFEDKKGSEEVYLHAEKDWKTQVEHDRLLTIGNDETITVKGKRTESVEKTESMKVGESRTTDVGKDDELKVGKKLTIDAGDQITLQTGAASITMKKDGTITIQGKDITIKGAGKIDLTAATDVAAAAGANVKLQGGAKVDVQGGAQVSVQGAMVGITGGLVKIN